MTDEIGKINGVPQRKIEGGHYTQAQVDEILAFDPQWIVCHLVTRLRQAVGAPEWVKADELKLSKE